MKYYYFLYCRIFDWYNTNGKKDKDTLRISALAFISLLPSLNILTVVIYTGLLHRHSYLNKWLAAAIVVFILIINLLLIPIEKSDRLRNEYVQLSISKRALINKYFYFYLVVTFLLFMATVAFVAYFKGKYGNYDHPV